MITRFFHADLGSTMRTAIVADQHDGRFAWDALVKVIENRAQ